MEANPHFSVRRGKVLVHSGCRSRPGTRSFRDQGAGPSR
jgi:hypothetical protein